jgi:hypothetical protein
MNLMTYFLVFWRNYSDLEKNLGWIVASVQVDWENLLEIYHRCHFSMINFSYLTFVTYFRGKLPLPP